MLLDIEHALVSNDQNVEVVVGPEKKPEHPDQCEPQEEEETSDLPDRSSEGEYVLNGNKMSREKDNDGERYCGDKDQDITDQDKPMFADRSDDPFVLVYLDHTREVLE